jgi:hypothetical protein
MRHFITYHNAKDMGYPSTALTDPHVKTKNPVLGLNGITVWLIAGEGKSPKSFLIAAMFIADKCETNKFPGTKLPNQISGVGTLYKLTKPIRGTMLLDQIRTESRNFQNGFHEVKDAKIIAALLAFA